jgi:hypothetical protein
VPHAPETNHRFTPLNFCSVLTRTGLCHFGTPLAPGPTGFVINFKDDIMWNWIACYVHGHDYTVRCESGAMFLRCFLCGRRSQGWFVKTGEHRQGT